MFYKTSENGARRKKEEKICKSYCSSKPPSPHTPRNTFAMWKSGEKYIFIGSLNIFFLFCLLSFGSISCFFSVLLCTSSDNRIVGMKRDADSSQRDPIPFPTEIPFYSFFNGWTKKIGKHFVELEKVWMLNVCLFLVAFPFTFRALSLDLLPAMFFHAISFCLLALNALPTSNYKSTKTNNENQQISSKSQWLKTKRESNERHQQLAQ